MGITLPMFQSRMVHLSAAELTTVNPHQIRNKSYRYYYKDKNPQALHIALEEWAKGNPLIFVGSMLHKPKKVLEAESTYQWTYEFQGRKY